MNEQERGAEYAYRTDKPDCDWPDHRLTWCGDCYVCAECGQKYISVRQTPELRHQLDEAHAALVDIAKATVEFCEELDALGVELPAPAVKKLRRVAQTCNPSRDTATAAIAEIEDAR